MYIQFQPLLLGAAALSDRMASWHRPWESTRDRSTFALGFSSALVTDVFVELSRTDDGKMLGKMVGKPPKKQQHTVDIITKPMGNQNGPD